jgi:hypothetical protein
MNKRLSPRRFVSLIVSLIILAMPTVVAILTAAPSGGGGTKGGHPGFGW